jgi:hypothetical protein
VGHAVGAIVKVERWICKEEERICPPDTETKEEGKTVKYYVAKNDVSENFHEDVCEATKKVKATGTVKEVDGKKELTASKITLAKD